ncbi:MAG: succinate dehydrogenase assembly factor 2 [Pseudomonadota bacterium]
MANFSDFRLKRLLFLSQRRGTQENDLLLGRFAERNLGTLGPEELDQFEALLAVEDAKLFRWITGQSPTPPEHATPVMQMIIRFNEEN